MRSKCTYITTVICVTIVSLLSALCTDAYLMHAYLWRGIGLQKSYNTGIAFSIDLGPLQSVIIIGALITIAVVAYKQAAARYEQIAFGLIVGGGLANIVDRIPDGRVTDMFKVVDFPIFNVADVCINIGVFVLIIASVYNWWRSYREAHS
jgi:lipoprotein signal peptidase